MSIMQNFSKESIKRIISTEKFQEITGQTLNSLFRCFLETAIENDSPTLVLLKTEDVSQNQGLLKRLEYSDVSVYFYDENGQKNNFNKVLCDKKIENDEFLITLTDRFTSCLYWEKISDELYNVFCSLNADDSSNIIKYLQSFYKNENLEAKMEEIKKDRRNNEKQTYILNKLSLIIDSQQRDLICTNSAIQGLESENKMQKEIDANSTLAHEIRNSLGMINLYSKIITKNLEKSASSINSIELTESLTNAAAIINKASVGIEKLLIEFIDDSKQFKSENCNLKEVIQDSINLIKPLSLENQVNIVADLTNADVEVNLDRYKLNQVLINIFKNAVEAMPDGGKLEIRTENNQNIINIDVKDTGKGIKKEDLDNIFNYSFTTKQSGSGIGLYESRKIMQALGGDINILSTSTEGTVFRLFLPIK